MTTRDVQATLGLSQQRVSQLVQAGELVVDRDPEGRLRYDRETVNRYAAERAARRTVDPAAAEEKRMRQQEARERFARERKARERAETQRREAQDALTLRAVEALEKIARCLREPGERY